ncbi:MAG TPA: ABC transporter permease [Bryobacteraceae bacterium]|nr:ABC transporter permease [Bryobacteraceae bacterium]
MKRLLRYLRAKQFARELAEEMQAHIDDMAADLIARGLPADQARAEAQRHFGNQTRLAERCRERWAFLSLEEIGQDLRYGLRLLRRSPVFTIVAAASLALGIAANTVIFSAVNHVVLHSLPYPNAGRLYSVRGRSAVRDDEPMQVSAADFYDWRTQSRAFESLSAYASWPMNLTNVDEPARLDTELVSANLFATLGAQARLGRIFLPSEDREDSPPVVVISDHLWRALGASPSIVGRELTLNGSPATVVGVMPAAFAFPSPKTDAWVPLALSAANRANRDGRWLRVIGRLRPGVSRKDAAAEFDVISRRLGAAYPKTNRGWSVSLLPLQEEIVGNTRAILLTLQGCTLMLLLIACANVANLLLARAASRTREIGVRAALGAGRARIVRQMIVESALLAAIGGGVGLTLAAQGIVFARRFGAALIPRASEIHLSIGVALFTAGITMATALVFGVIPALHASRFDLRTQIASGARGTPRNVEHKRGILVAVEVALCCVLLVGAALLGESLARLLSTAPGLRTDHVLTLRITLAHAQYPTTSAQNAFFQQLLDRVQSLPAVVSAAEISDTPLAGNNPTFEFAIDGVTRGPSDPPIQAGLRAISAGYLQTAGIPLLHGRGFSTHDASSSMPVAIVNQTMAHRYWPGADPVGHRLRFKDEQRWITVAGVAADTKHMGLKADEGPVVYIPYAQKTQDWLAWTTLFVRTSGEPMQMGPAIRGAIRGLDPNQPVSEVETLDDVLASSTLLPRFTTAVICGVSALALLIAIIGIYGLLAYAVARRTPEIGVRLTVGAAPAEVCWLLIRDAMRRVAAGIACGLLASWWLAKLLGSLLFGVRPHDPATFAAVSGLLIVAAAAAVLGPARRAMRIDPMAALRAE